MFLIFQSFFRTVIFFSRQKSHPKIKPKKRRKKNGEQKKAKKNAVEMID